MDSWRMETEALTSSKPQGMCVRSEFLWKLGSCHGYVKGIMREREKGQWASRKGVSYCREQTGETSRLHV